MSRRVVLPALLLAFLPAAPVRAQEKAEAVRGELVVRFKASSDASDRRAAREAADVDVVRNLRIARAQLVEVAPGQTVGQAVAALDRRGDVAFAEPNWIYHASATTPDDPEFSNLWGLHNTGLVFGGTDDADIDAPEAWDISTGSPNVIVAVADTGVAYDHPDLIANIWANDDPVGGGDDDGNGKIDDVRGWDFVDGDNDPRDLNDHGTHVAGTIAARGNNGVGVTGVSWSATIMPLRVLDAEGSGSSADIADAFDYAADNGAKVVNASLGGPGVSTPISNAITSHPETLYVVAAGNDAQNNDVVDDYPCNVPSANVICVAATNQIDALASFSNFGAQQVDLGAPGQATRSTVPATSDVFADSFEVDLANWVVEGTGGTFTDTATPTLPYGAAFPGPYGAGTKVLDDEPAVPGYGADELYWIRSATPVNLAGRVGCFLVYAIRWDFAIDPDARGLDWVRVQTSLDGSNWTTVDEYTGYRSSWYRAENYLSADGQEVYVRFLVDADGLADEEQFDGVQIDDVRVRCIDTTYDAGDYANFNGTSMATPHVAGAAAVLLAEHPDAPVTNLRSWLLNTGDPLETLALKTFSGRRLNLYQALVTASGTVLDPVSVTGTASSVTASAATVNGSVDPNGTETSYRFEWGTTTAYGSTAPATPVSVGNDWAAVDVSQQLTGLDAGTTYHYRLVAYRSGTPVGAPGQDRTFTTSALRDAGDVTPPAPPPSNPAPPSGTGDVDATPDDGDTVTIPDDGDSEPVAADERPRAVLTSSQPVGAVKIRITCTSKCQVSGRLTAANWMRSLLGGSRLLASGKTSLPAGTNVVRLNVRKAKLARLRRAGLKRATVVLRLTVSDADGQARRLTRKVRVRMRR